MDSTTNTPSSPADPLLDEIRALKESVSRQFGHDVIKLCEALRREQEISGRRVIPRKPIERADAGPR